MTGVLRFRLVMPAFLLAVLLLAGPQVPAAEPALNTPPDGFVALFNGQDLEGWQGLAAEPPARAKMSADELKQAQAEADEKARAHWTVVDGVLTYDGKGVSLCTARDYEDFELYVDWKIEPGGDSGIYLRGTPQVQIWDKPPGSGGLYNNQKHPAQPLIRADRPAGDWNTFRIFLHGDRVTVYLNGVLVTDGVPLENYWDRAAPLAARGAIELQHHGSPLYFRNIYLRELPRPAAGLRPAGPVLKRGDRVVIVGDSITEQKLYSKFMEEYLLACVPQLELAVVQLGWSGEQAGGFAARLANDLLPLKPTVVTTCYGMNDGRYRPYEPALGTEYEKNMRTIVDAVQKAGATIVVGSPGAVDTFTFKNLDPSVYNDNLAHLRDIARELAWSHAQPFANVHDAMILAMLHAKPVLGQEYPVCGGDGFHPMPNGQLVMAYAFLKALGLDSQIGTITVAYGDTGAPQVSATDGHVAKASGDGAITVESARWPFCHFGDETAPQGTRSILPFVPFNAELNRLTLVVTGLPGDAASVTWGSATKRFTKEQLAAGVNLAAEFVENPFSEPFKTLDEAVAKKQAYETTMIKEAITRFRTIRQLLGEDAQAEAAMTVLRDELMQRHARLADAVRAAIVPVRHEIRIASE